MRPGVVRISQSSRRTRLCRRTRRSHAERRRRGLRAWLSTERFFSNRIARTCSRWTIETCVLNRYQHEAPKRNRSPRIRRSRIAVTMYFQTRFIQSTIVHRRKKWYTFYVTLIIQRITVPIVWLAIIGPNIYIYIFFFHFFHKQNVCGIVLSYEALFSDNNGIEFAVTCAKNCKKWTGNFWEERRGKNNVPIIHGEKAKHVLRRSRGRVPIRFAEIQYSLQLTGIYCTLYDTYWHNIDIKHNFQLWVLCESKRIFFPALVISVF